MKNTANVWNIFITNHNDSRIITQIDGTDLVITIKSISRSNVFQYCRNPWIGEKIIDLNISPQPFFQVLYTNYYERLERYATSCLTNLSVLNLKMAFDRYFKQTVCLWSTSPVKRRGWGFLAPPECGLSWWFVADVVKEIFTLSHLYGALPLLWLLFYAELVANHQRCGKSQCGDLLWNATPENVGNVQLLGDNVSKAFSSD